MRMRWRCSMNGSVAAARLGPSGNCGRNLRRPGATELIQSERCLTGADGWAPAPGRSTSDVSCCYGETPMQRNAPRITLFTIVACLAVVAASAQVVREEVPGIQNFARVESTVACAGAITPDAITHIKAMGTPRLSTSVSRPSRGPTSTCTSPQRRRRALPTTTSHSVRQRRIPQPSTRS